MSTHLRIRFPLRGSREQIDAILFDRDSGIERLYDTDAEPQETLQSEIGTWIQLGMLIVAAAPAAKSLYELIQLLRSPSKPELEEVKPAPNVESSFQVSITINQINYDVTHSTVVELERLLKEDE